MRRSDESVLFEAGNSSSRMVIGPEGKVTDTQAPANYFDTHFKTSAATCSAVENRRQHNPCALMATLIG